MEKVQMLSDASGYLWMVSDPVKTGAILRVDRIVLHESTLTALGYKFMLYRGKVSPDTFIGSFILPDAIHTTDTLAGGYDSVGETIDLTIVRGGTTSDYCVYVDGPIWLAEGEMIGISNEGNATASTLHEAAIMGMMYYPEPNRNKAG